MAKAIAAAPTTPAPTWLLLAAPVNLAASVVVDVALLDLVVVAVATARLVGFAVAVAGA